MSNEPTPVSWDERLDRYAMRNSLGFTQFTHKKFEPESITKDQEFNQNMRDLLTFIKGQPDNVWLRKVYEQQDMSFIEHEGNLISSGAVIELCGQMCETKLSQKVLNFLQKENIPINHILLLLKKVLSTIPSLTKK